jgi:MFS family permease
MFYYQNNHYKHVFSNPGPNAQGAIVASMPAGSLVGALLVTKLGDKIGRKKTIIIAGMIWVLGSILQCASVVSINLYSPRSPLVGG